MPDQVFGSKVGRDQYTQSGSNNSFVVTHGAEVSRAEVDAAVAELRAFVAQLTRDGVVHADGSVADPGAVVAAVESQPNRLRALAGAVAGGAKDAVLSVVKDGVAALIVALVGRM
ncbi:hypothetical protein [Microbispora sp. ATCC PTA-5024]|uniref:hypothetical protein n=1 Tax=Microbispora sp. ATCC PTA-5024 TaxID=316330 RepID=UPI0003DC86FC|nr:hypothetical protein [Microbispora sp. ATCC PTA-5024]ETK33122.1 hypothetical protein MPTA5024_26340 [Microbispora sp. ATCC PTA-5024]